LVSHVAALVSHVAALVSHVAALISHISALVSHVAALVSHVAALVSHVAALISHVSALVSHVAALVSHVSALVSHVAVQVLLAMGTGGYNALSLNLRASVRRLGAPLFRSFCFVAIDQVALEAFRRADREDSLTSDQESCVVDGAALLDGDDYLEAESDFLGVHLTPA
jgi:hypothetical protein